MKELTVFWAAGQSFCFTTVCVKQHQSTAAALGNTKRQQQNTATRLQMLSSRSTAKHSKGMFSSRPNCSMETFISVSHWGGNDQKSADIFVQLFTRQSTFFWMKWFNLNMCHFGESDEGFQDDLLQSWHQLFPSVKPVEINHVPSLDTFKSTLKIIITVYTNWSSGPFWNGNIPYSDVWVVPKVSNDWRF